MTQPRPHTIEAAMHLGDGRNFASFVLLACWLGACAMHEEVMLGHAAPPEPGPETSEPRTLDLTQCLAVDCGEVAPEPPSVPAEPEPTTCEPAERRRIAVAWQHELGTTHACPDVGTCNLYGPEIAVTEDGQLWVTAEAHDPLSVEFDLLGVWLALYDPHGARVHEAMADVTFDDERRQVAYRRGLAVDGRGHLFLGLVEITRDTARDSRSTRGWIAEHGPDGKPIGERLAVLGSGRDLLLWPAGDDAIAVGRHDGEGGIALLETDGAPRWTQSRVHTPAVQELVSDARGRVSLFGGTADGPTIEQYDEEGRLAWYRGVPPFSQPGLVVDRHGNLIRAGLLDMNFGPNWIQVQKIDASGRTVWITHIAASQSYARTHAVLGPDDEVLILGTDRVTGVGGGRRTVIHTLSADGRSCELHELDPEAVDHVAQLAVASDGALYFGGATGVGRLAR